MNTAVPAFQDALTAVAKAADIGAPVTLGPPKDGLLKRHVVIAGKGSAQLSDGVSGYGQRDESLSCEVLVVCNVTGGDYKATRNEVAGIVSNFDDAIAADVTLGGVVSFCRITSIEYDHGLAEDGRTLQVYWVLTVTAEASVG